MIYVGLIMVFLGVGMLGLLMDGTAGMVRAWLILAILAVIISGGIIFAKGTDK